MLRSVRPARRPSRYRAPVSFAANPALPPPLPAGSAIVTWGDSGYQRGGFASATLVDGKAAGGIHWATALARQRGRHVIWFDPTSTVANRIPAYGTAMASGSVNFSGHNLGYWGDDVITGLGKRAAQVLATNPGLIFIRAGSNDAKANATPQAIITALQARIAQVVGPNRRVVIETLWPRQVNTVAPVATEVSVAQMATILAVNAAIRANWQAWGAAALVDPFEQLRDLSHNIGDQLYGSPAPGFTIDGAHMTIRSSFIIGQLKATAINALIAPGSWFNRDAGGLVSNWNLTGTGGTLGSSCTGPVPAGFVIQNMSGAGQPVTALCSLAANAETGGQTWTLALNSAGGGASDAFQEIRVTNTAVASGFAPADWFAFVPEMDVDGSATLACYQTGLTGTSGTSTSRGLAQMGMTSGSAGNEYYPVNTGLSLEPATMPWNVGAATNVQGSLRLFMRTDIVGTATVRLKRWRIPLVGNPSVDAPWVP